MLKNITHRIWLNLRVIRLGLAQKWLSEATFAKGYDQLAGQYDEAWLQHLQAVTDRLLAQLPRPLQSGQILDLGCGTGYTTVYLADTYPDHAITAVDISEYMLEQARQKIDSGNVEMLCADMLQFLRARPSNSAALIVSGWAIGYSRLHQVIAEAARVLKSGGTLAFVVNYADTLRPVWRAFRRCMQRFPEQVRLAYIPYFPRKWKQLRRTLTSADFSIDYHDEGEHIITPPADVDECGILPWLLHTGVLAGFDQMLPLTESEQLADYFEQLIQKEHEPITHHYVMVLARR
jgi:ubiquinone/menaquinone biosynthesis C-methylase UbiE